MHGFKIERTEESFRFLLTISSSLAWKFSGFHFVISFNFSETDSYLI